MEIREFQKQIEALYFEKDSARGLEGSFRWFVEEVGELAKALRRNDPVNLEEEFSDCLAWLSSLASLKGIDLQKASERYHVSCPKCKNIPCQC